MKSMYAFILGIFLVSTVMKAQVSLNTAPDFTVTDLDGTTFNLYNTLNQGKYVVVDFFYTTCGPCQVAAPKFKTAYQNYGCNTGDVIFISVERDNGNPAVQSFENTYVGANGPIMASGTTGGGAAVHTAFGPGAFPTLILIAPNKQIVEKDMWPITSAASFDPFLSVHGLTYDVCATAGVVEMASPFNLEFFPNPFSSILTIESKNNSKLFSYKIFDFIGRVLLSDSNLSGNEKISIEVSSLPSGFYFAEVMTSEGVLIQKINK